MIAIKFSAVIIPWIERSSAVCGVGSCESVAILSPMYLETCMNTYVAFLENYYLYRIPPAACFPSLKSAEVSAHAIATRYDFYISPSNVLSMPLSVRQIHQ